MNVNNYPCGFKLTLVFLAIATLSIEGGAQARRAVITDADKSEIIRQTLEPELVGQKVNDQDDQVTDFELMMRAKGGMVLSVKNIERNLVPQIPQIKLLVLEPHEIQEKAK